MERLFIQMIYKSQIQTLMTGLIFIISAAQIKQVWYLKHSNLSVALII